MSRWVANLGIKPPSNEELIWAGVAAVIVAVSWGVALLAARRAGPYLADWWERHAGARSEGIGTRMCDLVRYLIGAVILAIGINATGWPDLAAGILGLAL
ncbi:MAG TPA: hypothetical protein VK391_06030, partial [Allosphingosinicella sp.]|nr:hypothetical protein [Allosphingosinicella sp.]